MKLSTRDIQTLKARAHKLKPIVLIGTNGFTQNVRTEIDRGLYDHELIKIRINENDREARRELFAEICESVSGVPVQLIGSIGVIYRESEKNKS